MTDLYRNNIPEKRYNKQVFHREADLSLKEQVDLLKQVSSNSALSYSDADRKDILSNLKTLKFWDYILAKLIITKHYLPALLGLRLAYILKGDKW